MHQHQQTGKCICAAILAAAAALAAHGQTFDEMAAAGEDAVKAGRYPEAIRLYEKIVAEGKTYENIMYIKFELGWAYYLVGSFDKAIPLFLDLSGARAPTEGMKQQSVFLMAECHARLADSQPEESAERKKNLEESLKLHTQFQKDYPTSPYIPQSLYGRAFAYYLAGQMDKAEADLKTVITAHRTSSTAIDAYYLLASVFSQQGLELIKAGKRDEAKPFLDKARELFNQLAKQQSNLAMANDSTFALAETWFSAGLYLEAIQYFREVRSKPDVQQSLRKSLEALQTKLATQMAKREDTSQTKTEQNKLAAQLAAVNESPDRMISAYLRICEAFYRLQHFDEVRIICRHLMNFTEDVQKKQANMLLLNTYIEERQAEEAAREFAEFQQSFGLDPMAESVSLAIGQLFLARDELEPALAHLTRSVEDYPEAKTFEDALYLKFTVEYMLARHADVKATADRYAAKFPEGKYLPLALYYKGMSQAALGESEEGLATLTDVLARFPQKTENFNNVDEVALQKGILLVQLKKTDEAIKHFQHFIEQYKDSAYRPYALYQLGMALSSADRFEEAQAMLRQVAKDHPEHTVAPTAMFQIGIMHFQKEQFEEMAAVMREILQLFPDRPIATDAYFWLGFIAKKDGAFDDAVSNFAKSLETNPNSERAPECLLFAAQTLNEKADKMGVPAVLPEEQRRLYRETRLAAARKFEDMLAQYPAAEKTLEAIPGIAASIFELVRSKQMTPEEASAWFKESRARHQDNAGLQAQLLFSYGSYLMKNREQAQALEVFKESMALQPDVRLSPEMLTDYAEALKDAGSLAEAEKIYNKIIADYPDAPLALAPAWFGLADIKYLEKNYEEARNYFEKVLQDYPWFKRGKQGRVKLAAIYEINENYEEAEKRFTEVFNEETGEARLAASLGVARCQLARAERLKRAGDQTWQAVVKVASENLTKVTVLFEAYPEYVSDAYLQLGRACEMVGDVAKAKEMYKRVVDNYAKYPAAKPAGEQLRRLGG